MMRNLCCLLPAPTCIGIAFSLHQHRLFRRAFAGKIQSSDQARKQFMAGKVERDFLPPSATSLQLSSCSAMQLYPDILELFYPRSFLGLRSRSPLYFCVLLTLFLKGNLSSVAA